MNGSRDFLWEKNVNKIYKKNFPSVKIPIANNSKIMRAPWRAWRARNLNLLAQINFWENLFEFFDFVAINLS